MSRAQEVIDLLAYQDVWEEYEIDPDEITEDTWLLMDESDLPDDILEGRAVWVIRNGKKVKKTLVRKRKRVQTGAEKAARRKAARKRVRTMRTSTSKLKRQKSLRKRAQSNIKKVSRKGNMKVV